MFDLDKIKKESGLDARTLLRLEQMVRESFQSDDMMFELHFLRIVKAIKQGWITPEEALAEEVEV